MEPRSTIESCTPSRRLYASAIVPNTTRLVSIVDDDHSVRRALRRLVRLAGFTAAETFASAEDFLTSTFLEQTACLVLDIHLNGGMSGFELQTRLTADRIVIPIIFIAAHDDVLTRERAEASGAVAYLRKPFDDELLLDAIRGAVGGVEWSVGNDHRLDQGPNREARWRRIA
jgi:FixJ family two-component response regulator